MIAFTYLQPASLDEALALLAQHGDEAKVIAGGTGLVNLMKMNLAQPAKVIGLKALRPLAGIQAGDGLRIGALTTLRELEDSPIVRRDAALLSEACRHVATIRVRDMATLGGAMAHADPHLDTPPALIALGASIRTQSQAGTREIAVEDFFTGYFESVLAPDELVTEILIPAQPAGAGTAFLKFLPATHDDYATVSVAARVTLAAGGAIADARVALGASGLTPVRARKVEAALRGLVPDEMRLAEVAALVGGEVEPISDIRGSAEYKRSMAIVHVRRALMQAVSRARAGG
jgi:carbon-monoxide dehydrogenase medium subunit